MIPLAVAASAVWLVTALFWQRWRFPAFRRPGPAEEKFARVNLSAVAAQGFLAVAGTFVSAVTGTGHPLLGVAAAMFMLGAVYLYRIKLPSPSLWSYAGAGRHADADAPRRPTSRWPYTIAYTIGYLLLLAFFASP
ncbi:hypothetical protein ACX5I6_01195 [Arthrobacter sp. MMS24-T111]|uniref:hypothetical protein n=1 Tax=Pseudarthrobacter sp. efr-133-R2A-89 TaxID=3040302 RepID=UPI00255615EB|nr:hypothetical protein [Pseudarthrobacter sp. efr-133-R2A-89]